MRTQHLIIFLYTLCKLIKIDNGQEETEWKNKTNGTNARNKSVNIIHDLSISRSIKVQENCDGHSRALQEFQISNTSNVIVKKCCTKDMYLFDYKCAATFKTPFSAPINEYEFFSGCTKKTEFNKTDNIKYEYGVECAKVKNWFKSDNLELFSITQNGSLAIIENKVHHVSTYDNYCLDWDWKYNAYLAQICTDDHTKLPELELLTMLICMYLNHC